MKPNLLYITRQWPAFTGGGTPMRMGMTLQALAQDYAVHLLLVPASPQFLKAPIPAEIGNLCAAVTEIAADIDPDPAFANVFSDSNPDVRLAAELASTRTYHTSRSTPEMIERVVAAFPGVVFERIVVNRIYMAPFAEPLLRSAKDRPQCTLDLDDVESLTHQRIAALARDNGDQVWERMTREEARKFAALERELLPLFDEVWVCSRFDQEVVVNAYSHRGVRVVPNAVWLPPAIPPKPESSVSTLLFVGLMGYYPNRDAAVWLCREVLPLLRKESGRGIRIMIAGKRLELMARELPTDPDVVLCSDVKQMGPCYRDADIAVVPLRAGGGTRIKILEAFSYNRPVVSTSLGAEGLELTDGAEIKIADSAPEFAKACLQLLREPEAAQAICERAHKRLLDRHTPE